MTFASSFVWLCLILTVEFTATGSNTVFDDLTDRCTEITTKIQDGAENDFASFFLPHSPRHVRLTHLTYQSTPRIPNSWARFRFNSNSLMTVRCDIRSHLTFT